MNFTPEQVAAALAARQVSTQCPRCSTPDAFDVVEGYALADIVGQQRMAQAVLICRHCGFVSLHVLEALGLSPF